jgi:hypothetical protein
LFDLYDALYADLLQGRSEKTKVAIGICLTFLMYGYDSSGLTLPADNELLKDIASPISEAIAFATHTQDLLTTKELSLLCPSLVVLEIKAVMPEESSSGSFGNDASDSEDGSESIDIEQYVKDSQPPAKHAEFEEDINLHGFGFPHFTVREYLVTRQASRFSPIQGHIRLAQLCLDALSDPQMSSTRCNDHFFTYAAYSWASHLSAIRCIYDRSLGLEIVLNKLASPLCLKTDTFLNSSDPSPAFVKWSI